MCVCVRVFNMNIKYAERLPNTTPTQGNRENGTVCSGIRHAAQNWQWLQKKSWAGNLKIAETLNFLHSLFLLSLQYSEVSVTEGEILLISLTPWRNFVKKQKYEKRDWVCRSGGGWLENGTYTPQKVKNNTLMNTMIYIGENAGIFEARIRPFA